MYILKENIIEYVGEMVEIFLSLAGNLKFEP